MTSIPATSTGTIPVSGTPQKTATKSAMPTKSTPPVQKSQPKVNTTQQEVSRELPKKIDISKGVDIQA